jgi:hypothetical protein
VQNTHSTDAVSASVFFQNSSFIFFEAKGTIAFKPIITKMRGMVIMLKPAMLMVVMLVGIITMVMVMVMSMLMLSLLDFLLAPDQRRLHAYCTIHPV